MSGVAEAYFVGVTTGIAVGAVLMKILTYLLGPWLNDEPEGSTDNHKVPDFQQTLIELSKIPGLEIKGEGVHIKGPDLKGDGKT